MLKNNKTMKFQNLRRSDIIVDNTINRREIADQYLRDYIAAGYIIYDVVAESGFTNLPSKTAGKYICLWVNGTPTGTYNLVNTMFSTHTDVVIMGIRVDSLYQIVNIDQPFTLSIASPPVQGLNKFRMIFCNVKFQAQLTGLSELAYCNFTTDNQQIDINNLNIIRNCTLSKLLSGEFALTAPGSLVTLQDCELKTSINTSYSGSLLSLINCNITSSITLGQAGATSRLDVRYQNVYIASGVTLTLNCTCTTSENLLYNNGGTIAGIISGIIVQNISKSNWTALQQNLASAYILDSALYTTASIIPTYTRKSIRGYLGTIKRNYYQLAFNPQNTIADTLKYNDDNDLLLWYRDDIEADFTTALIAKIKNQIFYKTDGATAVTTYRDSESYLIIAERDSVAGTYGIFGYHKGQILTTIYSEIWNNETYTIKRVFNILEFPEEASYTNLYNISNSPIEASYLMQDITSKVVK